MSEHTGEVEFDEAVGEEEAISPGPDSYSQAVVHATDWTTETIISQLKRGNIALNPRFQRRDAWAVQRKSRFVESLIMGLPVPQIVLAEQPGERGRFLVLDGKQRLLSLLQFWGLGEGRKNRFQLSGLEVLTNLNRKRYSDLEADPTLSSELNDLLNQTIRTVVIRNWPSTEFLHMVFLRLNTGSTKLSPQELRQALQPGQFTDWVDEVASESPSLRELLRIDEPDDRMRDTEILARFIAMQEFIEEYPGRLKPFLDATFEKLNRRWDDSAEQDREEAATALLASFEHGLSGLLNVFGQDLARRPGSRLLNRTLLDMLLFFSPLKEVLIAIEREPERTREAYFELFEDSEFVSAIESDTASTSNTAGRLAAWSRKLSSRLGVDAPLIELESGPPERIRIQGR